MKHNYKLGLGGSLSGSELMGTAISKHVPDFPDIGDLSQRLRFSPQLGRIMLDDRRMFLMHVSSLSTLRRELIETMGTDAARGLLTRIGYQAGARDAELTKKVRNESNTYDSFLIGPQVLALEGAVFSQPLDLVIDVENGKYFGEFIWRDSSETEAHIAVYGIGSAPICWMQIGYACGFTSTFMGRPILYRELECRGMGHEYCRLIGKPMDEWEHPEEDARFLTVGDFVKWAPSAAPGPEESTRKIKTPTGVMPSDFGMIGVSAGFNTVCHLVKKSAPTDATVLFLGESGVGKEIFAQNLHSLSGRAKGPFVAVNCAAIPEHLIESELFGVEKGGYTGATTSRPGRFERANGGTLFLDEIGTLSLTAQGKLLRALQQGEIERVGDTKARKVDVRVIAATNVNLREAAKTGDFREDLYYRLNVFPIRIPPLRDRRDDVPLLIDWFLQRFCGKHRKIITGLRERALDALINYDWPGNIRELENMVERAVILADENTPLDICHLFTSGEDVKPESLTPNTRGIVSNPTEEPGNSPGAKGDIASEGHRGADDPAAGILSLPDSEAALIKAAILQAKGNLSKAARLLNISRPTLAYRARKYGLE